MTTIDDDTVKRAMRQCELMNEYLRTMTPQQRDRNMQVHLAQARGPVGNAILLRQMTGMMIRLKQAQRSSESRND